MTIEYRPLNEGEQPAFFAIVDHALGGFLGQQWPAFIERIGAENLRGIHDNGRLVGGLGIYRMKQWFGGRAVRCGGVSVVGMAPEVRGRGGAKQALTEMLRELRADGTPIACLYPSTQKLYRSVGFEQAGSFCRYELPLASIGVIERDFPVTRVDDPITRVDDPTPGPFEKVAAERGRVTNGTLARTSGLWQRIFNVRDKPAYTALIGDPDNPEGYVCYINGTDADRMKLLVTDMAALTPIAGRRLWTFLADHRSIFSHVCWTGPPTEPLLTFAEECKRLPVEHFRWMLRIINVAAALEARGYPEDASGEAHLDVADEQLPENAGRFVLRVKEGEATVTSGGSGSLRIGVGGLAALYSGFLPPQTLRAIGRLDGDDESLRRAARLFAGPEPWMTEIF